jgi:hypothetical protein
LFIFLERYIISITKQPMYCCLSRVKFAVDYFGVCGALAKSKIALHSWVLMVKPWTFVHPQRLSAYLEAKGPHNPEVGAGWCILE